MKIDLVALRDHFYAGRRIKAEQKYSTSYRHGAALLVKLGHARYATAAPDAPQPEHRYSGPVIPLAAASVEEQPERAAQGEPDAEIPGDDAGAPLPETEAQSTTEPAAQAEASEAAEDPAADISPRTGKPRRQYRRRDMSAEG